MRFLLCAVSILLIALQAEANVEKVIFVTDPDTNSASWEDYYKLLVEQQITVLVPGNHVTQRVHAAFPASPALNVPRQAWFLLDELQEGRRYELRASFGALQPCDVNHSTVSLTQVLGDPHLKGQLEDYLADASRPREGPPAREGNQKRVEPLLYHIQPSANFFTSDRDLMRDGNVVSFDFTLDAFLFNVFPESLLPTAIYIAVIAGFSTIISALVWRSLLHVARLDTEIRKSKIGGSQNKND